MSRYEERKLAGVCTRGCGEPAADDQQMCERCLKRFRKQTRNAMRDLRAARRARGCCAYCETKSASYRCPAHAIKRGEIPTAGVITSVIRGVGDQWRRDGNGWERFRGKGVRGAPTAAAKDEADLIEAVKALEKGRKAMAYAHSEPVKKLGRIQQADAREAAAGMLAMAARFVADVMSRYAPDLAGGDAETRAADAEIEAEIEAARAVSKSDDRRYHQCDTAHPAIRPQHTPRAR